MGTIGMLGLMAVGLFYILFVHKRVVMAAGRAATGGDLDRFRSADMAARLDMRIVDGDPATIPPFEVFMRTRPAGVEYERRQPALPAQRFGDPRLDAAFEVYAAPTAVGGAQ